MISKRKLLQQNLEYWRQTIELVEDILQYRAYQKLNSTYVEGLLKVIAEDGRIHTRFNQTEARTGRLSSDNPNLQNIPIRTELGSQLRAYFVARPGCVLVDADYSQIELRILAHVTGDEHMQQAFLTGEDIHRSTAAKIYNLPLEQVTPRLRSSAKAINFGIMYGISAFGLAQRLRIGRKEAQKIIDDYFAGFPSILSFIEDTKASARETGYVETIFGRRRYIPDINSKNGTLRTLAERNAVNAPIQGTSADIIKMAMIEVDKAMAEAGMKSRMVLQIHDELVFDAIPEEIEDLKRIVIDRMENVVKLSVPLTVECNYGKNWLEAH